MKNIVYPVINKGIVSDENGVRFTFRSFINHPLGYAYLYPLDKNEHVVKLEMDILNKEDKDMPVFFPAQKRAYPVYWDEDGLPNIAVLEINVFVGMLTFQLDLVEIEPQFLNDHCTMFDIFKRHYDSNEKERVNWTGDNK